MTRNKKSQLGGGRGLFVKLILSLLILFTSGCMIRNLPEFRVEAVGETPPTADAQRYALNCPVTPPEQLSQGPIHILHGPRYWIAGGNKVIWQTTEEVPPEANFVIFGYRLDGEAPLISEEVGRIFRSSSRGSGVDVPGPGCWQVEGRVGEYTKRFVVEVYPRAYRDVGPSEAVEPNIEDIVYHSDTILIAKVEGTIPDRPGFTWQTVSVIEIWKGLVGVEERLDILVTDDEQSLRNGHQYILFLRDEPGKPWRILFPLLTLGEVVDDQINPLTDPPSDVNFWPGKELDQMRTHIQNIMTVAEPANP